jgi:peptidylprolyl isomerase
MRIAGKVRMVGVVMVAVATLSACANSEQDSTQTPGAGRPELPTTTSSKASAAVTASSAPQATSTPYKPGPGECTADDVKVEGGFGEKPTITLPTTCQPPKGLVTKDLVPGTGAEIKTGSSIEANYLLQTWSDKQIVDNSFDRQQTLPVQVGGGQVIQGWDEGLLGLKEGGRRLLIIPPDLGYGPEGKEPVQPNETLVFVTDAVKVTG